MPGRLSGPTSFCDESGVRPASAAARERTVDRVVGAAARLAVMIVVAAVTAFLFIFFVFPLATILWRGRSLDSLAEVFGSSSTWKILWFTLWQAAASTALTVVLALPVAHAIARYRFRGRGLLRAVVTVPFVLPTVVVATAFLSVSDRLRLEDDPVRLPGTAWAILVAHAFFNIAVIVRSVGGYWSQLDNSPEAAARTLGAGGIRTFLLVTAPRLRPALVSSSAIVFLFSFTSFGVVLLLGGLRRVTIETEIWRHATQRTDFSTAAALGLLQLAVVVTMLVVNSRHQRRLAVVERTRAPVEMERRVASRHDRLLLGAALAVVGVLVLVPLGVLVERSLATSGGHGFTYYRALGDQDARVPLLPVSGWTAVRNSLTWALLAAGIATIVGTVAGLMAGSRHRRLARSTDIAFLLPLGTSAVLVGFGMLIALDEPPLDIRTRWWIVPVAQALIGVPFVMRTVSTAVRSIDPALREAAATMGASPGRVWREVDMPIASRAVVIGAVFAFTIAVGEFGATAFLARPQRPTVPTAIFRLLGRPGDLAFGQAMALSVILMIITASAVLVIERMRVVVAGEL
jgi:thiamine transport system permease protein